MRIKKGDSVIVLRGKGVDKGKIGTVLRSWPKEDRVLVQGINMVTRHVKAGTTTRGARTGGMVHEEAPIHVSRVSLVTEVEGKRLPTRTGVRIETVERPDGRVKSNRVRVARRTGEDL